MHLQCQLPVCFNSIHLIERAVFFCSPQTCRSEKKQTKISQKIIRGVISSKHRSSSLQRKKKKILISGANVHTTLLKLTFTIHNYF